MFEKFKAEQKDIKQKILKLQSGMDIRIEFFFFFFYLMHLYLQFQHLHYYYTNLYAIQYAC